MFFLFFFVCCFRFLCSDAIVWEGIKNFNAFNFALAERNYDGGLHCFGKGLMRLFAKIRKRISTAVFHGMEIHHIYDSLVPYSLYEFKEHKKTAPESVSEHLRCGCFSWFSYIICLFPNLSHSVVRIIDQLRKSPASDEELLLHGRFELPHSVEGIALDAEEMLQIRREDS